MRNENCYDFGRCIESWEITTSSDKLVAAVDGSELCIYYLHHQPYVGTITLTPSSCLSTGDPVTWTIYANQEQDCGGFGGEFRSLQEESSFSVFPNPFIEALNINYSGWEKDKTDTVQLLNIDGRLIRKSDQREQRFDTADLAAGVYILRILDDRNQLLFMDKYIKQ